MDISLSPFPPMAPQRHEAQPPAGGNSDEKQTTKLTGSEHANEPDAEERESKQSPRVSGGKEAAHLNPSSPEYHKLQELKTRDREVRAHEMAHLAAAGPYARGGPSFDYERGADGRRYATGGHVNIDTSPVPGNPEATLRKAEAVRRAALAPAEPSPQDRRVAADAAAMVTEARMAVAAEQSEKLITRAEPGTREGEDKGSSDTRESLVTKERPAVVRGSLVARLAASGAVAQDVSAGLRIDLHA